MSRPSLSDRVAIAGIELARRRQSLSSRLRVGALLGWGRIRPLANELVFVPSDLRPADPSFLDEISAGSIGLGGTVVDVGAGSPFVVEPPDRNWARALHGFGWLGNLRAAGSAKAVDIARRLVADWCRRHRTAPGGRGIAAEPDVVARRVISWITSAGFLLEDADDAFYTQLAQSLGRELQALDAARTRAAAGLPRLECLLALTLASLAIAGHERDLVRTERELLAELGRQILPDGCHVTRNPNVVLDILLELLPIRQCYRAREMTVPARLLTLIESMQGFLRLMSLGTGELARFNGVGPSRADALANVLAVDFETKPAGSTAPGASGYARLERGCTALIVDCAGPPPLVHAGAAHAGALSFELASDGELIVSNGGAPAASFRRALADARATASHSTLVLGDRSSSRLVQSRMLERHIGALTIAGPGRISVRLEEKPEAIELTARHDGYLSRFGLLHERLLALSSSGDALEGRDRLQPPAGAMRLARDLPFAVHFHLGLNTVRLDGDAAIVINPPRGPAWRMTSIGCRMAIESSVDYATHLGPSPTRQIVLRASCPGEASVDWRLQRVSP